MDLTERQALAESTMDAMLRGDAEGAMALALTMAPDPSMAEVIAAYDQRTLEWDDEAHAWAAQAIDCMETISANGITLLEAAYRAYDDAEDRRMAAVQEAQEWIRRHDALVAKLRDAREA